MKIKIYQTLASKNSIQSNALAQNFYQSLVARHQLCELLVLEHDIQQYNNTDFQTKRSCFNVVFTAGLNEFRHASILKRWDDSVCVYWSGECVPEEMIAASVEFPKACVLPAWTVSDELEQIVKKKTHLIKANGIAHSSLMRDLNQSTSSVAKLNITEADTVVGISVAKDVFDAQGKKISAFSLADARSLVDKLVSHLENQGMQAGKLSIVIVSSITGLVASELRSCLIGNTCPDKLFSGLLTGILGHAGFENISVSYLSNEAGDQSACLLKEMRNAKNGLYFIPTSAQEELAKSMCGDNSKIEIISYGNEHTAVSKTLFDAGLVSLLNIAIDTPYAVNARSDLPFLENPTNAYSDRLINLALSLWTNHQNALFEQDRLFGLTVSEARPLEEQRIHTVSQSNGVGFFGRASTGVFFAAAGVGVLAYMASDKHLKTADFSSALAYLRPSK